jgi:hypothetical protein
VKLVIATAEPYGSYHLRGFRQLFDNSPHEFVHLIPYDEQTQGEPVIPTTGETDCIFDADRIIITGGCFSPWTLSLSFLANQLNIPVYFSELAFVPLDVLDFAPPAISKASVFGSKSGGTISRVMNVAWENITLTGSVHTDDVPQGNSFPSPASVDEAQNEGMKTIVIATTDNYQNVDPENELLTTATALQSQGYRVVVSLHSRIVDSSDWEGFEIVHGVTKNLIAASHAVVGYIGTTAQTTASLHIPFVALDPLNKRSNAYADAMQLCAGYFTNATDVLANISNVKAVPAKIVHSHVKPSPDSHGEIFSFWIS